MAEEPGDSDESPDDVPPSSSDSDASQPGDDADEVPADDSDAGEPDADESDADESDADESDADESDADRSPTDADDEDADATGAETTESGDGDDLTPAIRQVSDDGDVVADDAPIPAVREVGDVDPDDEDAAAGAGDADDADSRTEVEYDASEAEELFSIPDPADADDGDDLTPAVREIPVDAESGEGDDGPALEDAYPGRGEIETPPARDDHEPDGADAADGEPGHEPADDGYETVDDDMDAPLAGEAAREAADAPASDGGYADEVGGGNEYGHTHEEVYDDDVYEDEEWEPEGAPDDEEMPLADHIEEMVRRLGVVVVVMAVVSGVVFPFAEELINFLWFSYLPGELVQCPGEATTAAASTENPGPPYCARVYHPLGLILARLKVATLVGFIVALPVFVYETYLFMRPGLYPHERRYYLASVPTSTVLAAVGVAFAHFLVIPAIFTYFLRYSEEAAGIAFGLTETFDLMVLLMGGFALVFQIPLFIMLALMMDLVTRKWLHDRRLLFWGAFAGIAFLFSPDPTGMAPIIVAVTMIVLFEGTLYLAKWTGRG
jgi:sec-independent protein translocase protein TatC